MDTRTDMDIVESVRGGDVDAFAELVARYSQKVYALVCGITGNAMEAEEITQDTFIRVFDHLGQWRGTGGFQTWLYRIAYNAAVSSLRRRPHIDLMPLDEGRVGERAESEQTWKVTESNMAAMERALAMMPATERTALTLFYMEDKTIEQIAIITQRSRSNVKVILHRSRQRLKKLMEEMNYEHGR